MYRPRPVLLSKALSSPRYAGGAATRGTMRVYMRHEDHDHLLSATHVPQSQRGSLRLYGRKRKEDSAVEKHGLLLICRCRY